MHFLYVLKSVNHKRTYIGITEDVEKRLREHNRGMVRSTRFYRPYTLAHTEMYRDKTDARRRELILKRSWSEKEKLLKSLGLE